MKSALTNSIFLLLVPFLLTAQEKFRDTVLEEKIAHAIKGYRGDVGIYVYHLNHNTEAGINADTIFPTASIVKVPILVSLFRKIKKDQIKLADTLVYSTKRSYGGSGFMQYFKDSTTTNIRNLASLMISVSDNTASLWCQELVGGGDYINATMSEFGLKNTRVNSRTKGREGMYEKYGWGQTTPREMSSLLVKMRKRQLISEASSDEMYRLMCHSFYTEYSLSQIPPFVQVASKQGMVDQSRSELVMVNAPNGDYVFYIATKNNEDDSWEYGNEAWQLQRIISSLLWQYFEPEIPWKPATGYIQLYKGSNN